MTYFAIDPGTRGKYGLHGLNFGSGTSTGLIGAGGLMFRALFALPLALELRLVGVPLQPVNRIAASKIMPKMSRIDVPFDVSSPCEQMKLLAPRAADRKQGSVRRAWAFSSNARGAIKFEPDKLAVIWSFA